MSFGRGMKIEFKICIFSPCFKAEEGEKNCKVELETEKRILEEFGRCLAQIIEFSGKFKKTSSLLQ